MVSQFDSPEYLSFTTDAQGQMHMEFKISEYLTSRYDSLTDAQKAILDDPTRAYAFNYISVMPRQNARITNTASVTSTTYPGGVSDGGWFQYVEATGWGTGEFAQQLTTDLTVTKEWVDTNAADAPEITVALLADDQPAIGLNEEILADQQVILNAGNNFSYTWENLPTQRIKDQPITYTVDEFAVDGYTTTYSGPYVPDLIATAPADTLTVTNTPIPSEEPTEDPMPTDELSEDPMVDPTPDPPDDQTDDPTTDQPSGEPTDDPTASQPGPGPRPQPPAGPGPQDPGKPSGPGLVRTGAEAGQLAGLAVLMTALGLGALAIRRRAHI